MHKEMEAWQNILKTAKARQRQVQKQVCAVCPKTPQQACKTCRLLGQIDSLQAAMYIAGYATCMRHERERRL